MTEGASPTVAALAALIERDWGRMADLARMADPSDLAREGADGWTAADHLLHVAAWGDGLVGLLAGRSLYDALGVPPDTYDLGGIDAVNARLFEAGRRVSPEEAPERFDRSFDRVLALVRSFDDGDLTRDVPVTPGGRAFPLYAWVEMLAAAHAADHVRSLEAMVGDVKAADRQSP